MNRMITAGFPGSMAAGLLAALLGLLSLGLAGCASSLAATPPEAVLAEGTPVRVELLVVAVDAEQFRNSSDARWLQSFLVGETRDIGSELSRADDLLIEGKRRMRGAPGYRFMREPVVTVRAGSRASVSAPMGTGSSFEISVRPREVRAGLYEMSARVAFTHDQASGNGEFNGVSYRAPALRYGSVPMTMRAGESRAVRLRKEIGQSIRPAELEVFVFARLTPEG